MPGHCEPPKCLKSKDIAAKDAKNRVVRGLGATRPAGLPLAAKAALVAPAHVLPETRASTGTVQSEYRDWPQTRPEGGPS